MSERTFSVVICDLCGSRSQEGRDSLDAGRLARAKKWSIIRCDVYGNEVHVCPTCFRHEACQTDEGLIDRIIRKAEASTLNARKVVRP